MTALVVATAAASPLADARTQLREAIDILGFDDGMFAMLATPRRETAQMSRWTRSGPWPCG